MNMEMTFKLLVLIACSHAALGVIVQTKYGAVQGQSHTLHNGKEVNSFLGIPFAKPPTGELRWKAPEDPASWTDVLKADRIRSACLQRSKLFIHVTHDGWEDFSEDCLFLNIYTPKDMSKGPYPVFVWMYGGGFTFGANFQYSGYFFSAHDTVVVVPNYRLDSMGFVSTGDSVSPGNYGLLDQQKALHFIRDNIKNFGGDANKVTIAGQSAGGSSVGFHTLSPTSKGLFHQAILQSGTDLNYWALQTKAQKPWTYTEQLATAMNCTTSNNVDMINCLREKPGEEIIKFMPTCTPGFSCMGFGPVIDGSFLPDDPFILRNTSNFNRVPTMSGIMEHDASFIIALLFWWKEDDEGVTHEEFEEVIREEVLDLLRGNKNSVEDVYNAVQFYYTSWGQQHDNKANRARLVDLWTDTSFGIPSHLVLRDVSAHTTAYSYVMRYRSQNSIFPAWIGATHSLDVPFVFGNNYLHHNPSVLTESGFTDDGIEWTVEDDNMADLVMTLWTNFVKTGNPTPAPVTMPGNKPVLWKPYTQDTKETFIIDTKLSHVSRYRNREYALFTEYIPYLLSKNQVTQLEKYSRYTNREHALFTEYILYLASKHQRSRN